MGHKAQMKRSHIGHILVNVRVNPSLLWPGAVRMQQMEVGRFSPSWGPQ